MHCLQIDLDILGGPVLPSSFFYFYILALLQSPKWYLCTAVIKSAWLIGIRTH